MKDNTKSTPIIIIIALVALVLVYSYYQEEKEPAQLKKFSSIDELKTYLKSSSEELYYSYSTLGATRSIEAVAEQTMEAPGEAAVAKSEDYSEDYSTTNIQVAGVDEADIVKNDGKYIYTIAGNKVIIVDAYPAEDAEIVSEIELESIPSQIFINNDRLAVFGSNYAIYKGGPESLVEEVAEEMRMPYYDIEGTFINIYDITDRSNPVLINNFTIDGNYYNSRMIGNYIYLITNQPVYNFENPVIPRIAYCGETCIDVWYFDVPENNHQFTIISALDIQNPEEPETEVFLMGYTQNLYVSADNIYVTYTKRLRITDFLDRIINAILPIVPADVALKINEIQASVLFSDAEKMSAIGRVLQDYSSTLTPEEQLNFQKKAENAMIAVQEQIAKEMEKTIIHKISIANGKIEYKLQGEVPGNVLNQFSMDEYNKNFRIATTTDSWRTTSKNHLYVLDENLNIIGKLEDLASGERIYSVRFIGSKAYMVTFRQVDPLFVIDLEDPINPNVLGYLKIPGVSEYLHPYDENHLIGVGRDATDGVMKGMKLSLFDITDVENPEEISKYIIGERGTDSDALRDHKAFLFSRAKNLLVIPVRLAEAGKWNVFQGAYVFNLDLEKGFELKGRVTHTNQTGSEDRYYYDYTAQVKRSLYIDDILYTISQKMIKMNELTALNEINKIEISSE